MRARMWMPLLGSTAVLVGLGCGDQAHQDSAATPFVVADGMPAGSRFAAASNGAGFLVVFPAITERGESDIVGLRMSPQGKRLDAAPFPISPPSSESRPDLADASYGLPAVAAADSGYGVTYLECTPGEGCEVALVPISPEGTATAPPAVAATWPLRIASTGISGRGSGFTTVHSIEQQRVVPPAVVSEFSIYTARAVFVRLERDRVAVDSVVRLTPDTGISGIGVVSAVAPSVASGAKETLAAWIETRFTFADGVLDSSLQGAWLAPQAPVERKRLATVSSGVGATATASGTDDFLVVWTATPPGSSDVTELRGVLVRREDHATGPDFIVAEGAAVKELGGVAFAHDRYLVLWSESGTVAAAYIDRDGSVGAPFAVEGGPATAETALASDGTRFLVLFARSTASGTNSLHGMFVD